MRDWIKAHAGRQLTRFRTNRVYTTGVLLGIGLVFSLGVSANMPKAPPIRFDGMLLHAHAYQKADHVFLPARVFFKKFNASVYAPVPGTLVAFSHGRQIARFVVGSKAAIINGRARLLPAAPYLYRNQTMVPLRIIGEAAGASVAYTAYPRGVHIVYHAPHAVRHHKTVRANVAAAQAAVAVDTQQTIWPWWIWLLIALGILLLLLLLLRIRRRPLIVTTSRPRPSDPVIVTRE